MADDLGRARLLIQAHANPLRAIAAVLIGDDDAAAVVVEAVLDACRDRRILGDGAEVRAVLAALLYRRCTVRLATKQQEDLSPAEPLAPAGAAGRVARLCLRHRAVIGLVFIGGQSLVQAAATLGVPIRTVMSDLSAALDALRAEKAGFTPPGATEDWDALEPKPATVRSRSASANPTPA